MTYPSDFESKTGFNTVRQLIINHCTSTLGAKCAETMKFSRKYDTVSRLLRQVAEMQGVINSDSTEIPAPVLHDITPYLSTLNADGSYLSADNLLKLRSLLSALGEIQSFFSKSSDGKFLYPLLAAEFADIDTFPQIISGIDAIINKFGQIKDTASPRLHDLRRDYASAQHSVSSAMRRVMSRAVSEGILDADSAPAMRDGRLCIPVNAMSKRKISGIVHDQSASGKTFFIEPAEVVEAANRARELEIDIQHEEIAILTAFADTLRPETRSLAAGAKKAGIFDFIRAKARFADDIGAQMPVMEKKPEIDWYHAVHPVLLMSLRQQKREVVPLDITLTGKDRFLVISGPNAGGKSVTLKTVALLQYMAQCGVMPPLYSNSHIGIFDNIFIDIGDQQSIENDLSTYSSHLRNMKYFLSNADSRTLILIDEMGSGTEPQIGGALAQSILEQFGKAGAMGIITTHYQNLKTFAQETDGFQNAAMLYDRQNLCPLFKLAVGNPGSSFAIEIARKTGLPADVVSNAEKIVGTDYVNMDKYLLDIARDRRYWTEKRAKIKEKEKRLDDILERYESGTDSLKAERKAILNEARIQAKEMLENANARLEKTIREIREANAEKEITKRVRKELEEYKQSIASGNEPESNFKGISMPKVRKQRKRPDTDKREATQKAKELQPGDYVRMSDGGVVGKILSISGKKAEVAFGALRTIADISKLIAATKPKESGASTAFSISKSTSDDSRSRQLNFKTELDVRGMRADEALQAVSYFIDDALQFSASKVRILHGTGHGILRTLIRQQLNTNPAISSYADEDVRFGGAGITVVNLA